MKRPAAPVPEAVTVLLIAAAALRADKILIPMDMIQTDHLKAYGVAYRVLKAGQPVEWLLNYRGGSFLLDADRAVEIDCGLADVCREAIPPSAVLGIYRTIEENNMETVLLEKAPRIAVYIPDNFEPWDDAVTLALEYAGIPYERIWDDDVLAGGIDRYDWIHLHHEDFTGQYGKFFGLYRNVDWYRQEVKTNEELAARLGFRKVSQMKLAVALAIKDYVKNGGFIFAMCSAGETCDIALAAANTDICHEVFDHDPVSYDANARLDYRRGFAFENFKVIVDPFVYEHSDIDVKMEAQARGPDAYFSLFDFSAKFDPVPCMLVQNHTALVKEFLGQCTGFNRDRVKSSAVVLAEVAGTEEVKYLHGNYEKGTFTYLGGHDPEDYEHMVGEKPTLVAEFRNSPGYRLILNNVLFPAARKKELKT